MLELILAMSIWGSLGAFVLWSGMSALDIAFYRCVIGALLLSGWMLRTKPTISLDKNTRYMMIAGVCLVLNWVFLFQSFQVANITIGNMSYYLQPILMLLLGVIFYGEQVRWYQWLLIFCALGGVMLCMDMHSYDHLNWLYGAVLALIAALLYSFVTLLMKQCQHHYFLVIFIQLSIGAVCLWPFVQSYPHSSLAWLCVLVIGLVHTVLAYVLYYRAIHKISVTKIAVFSYLDPVVAMLTDILFFDRHFNVAQCAGIILSFAALYLLVMCGQREETTAQRASSVSVA